MLLLAALLVSQTVDPPHLKGATIVDADNAVAEGTAVLNENLRARADRCERAIVGPNQALSDECQMFLEGFNRAMRSKNDAR